MKEKLGFAILEPYQPEELAAVTGIPNDGIRGAYGRYYSRLLADMEPNSVILLLQSMLFHLQQHERFTLQHRKGQCRIVVEGADDPMSRALQALPGVGVETARWALTVFREIEMYLDPARRDEFLEHRKRCGIEEWSYSPPELSIPGPKQKGA